VFAQDGPAPPTVRQLRAGVVPVLLDPSLLLSTYRLEAMGTKTVAGRDAFDVRAVARTVVPVPPLGRGVDAARLAVDATTGLLTFAETTIGGDVAERVEAVRLVVDEALDDDTFDLTAPAGAVPHMIESIGVEELARRIQALDEPDRFTLEAPAEGDDARSWRGWLARPGGDARPFAVLHAAAPGQRRFVSLHEAASPGAMPDTGEWEPVTIDGDDARRWVADEGCDVVLRRGATWVWVRNCATYDDAVTLVRRLRAVSPA
jgi:hypothetical protein